MRAFVDEACRSAGAEPLACSDLKLAVDEACTNIVEHGYAGMTPGDIRISVASDGERLTVVISDRGRSFDPEKISRPDPGAVLDDREPGGLGWHLIRSTVDEYRYEPGGGEDNRLTLVKRTGTGKI